MLGMKRTVAALGIAAITLGTGFASTTASAAGRDGVIQARYYGYYHRHNGFRGAPVAGAIIGGLAAGAIAHSYYRHGPYGYGPPAYYAPGPYYYDQGPYGW